MPNDDERRWFWTKPLDDAFLNLVDGDSPGHLRIAVNAVVAVEDATDESRRCAVWLVNGDRVEVRFTDPDTVDSLVDQLGRRVPRGSPSAWK